jgi:predicted aminopeptidase
MKFLIFSLLIFSGCGHVSYLTTQLGGQLRLVNSSRPNEEVLENIKVRPRDKKKILKIQNYKKFFYEYWQIPERNIYSRTTLLKNKAVTYLVVASKPNVISAKQFCFPLAGCFPYLGFFDKKDAEAKQLELKGEGMVTDIRSVYAYSTLGYMSDPIISSLFLFDEMELAEIIFHELFHTLFFVKNDVAFNEALADFMALHLLEQYFDKKSSQERLLQRKKQKLLNEQMVQLTSELNNEYKKVTDGYDGILATFLQTRLRPVINSFCSKEGILPIDCYPLDKAWNNAGLSGFLTYASDGDWIDKLYTSKGGSDLRTFYNFLRSEYNRFDESKSTSFSEFLRSQL